MSCGCPKDLCWRRIGFTLMGSTTAYSKTLSRTTKRLPNASPREKKPDCVTGSAALAGVWRVLRPIYLSLSSRRLRSSFKGSISQAAAPMEKIQQSFLVNNSKERRVGLFASLTSVPLSARFSAREYSCLDPGCCSVSLLHRLVSPVACLLGHECITCAMSRVQRR